MVLTGRRRLVLDHAPAEQEPLPGFADLRVLYCGVCRTDAKMWNEGHRDLALPRVPGHEVVAADEAGQPFAVWPGRSCGRCPHCRGGRANLCTAMEILGFHRDGGFAQWVRVPESVLVPVPHGTPPLLAALAEPAGCALHALEMLRIQADERVLICGGGTMGLLAALACLESGARPTVVEKSEHKIAHTAGFLKHTGIECCPAPPENAFDAALTACPDPDAFRLATERLAKGGRLSLFSGMTKDASIAAEVLNLIHYKEVQVYGAYGLCREDLATALDLIHSRPRAFELLLEGVVPLYRVPDLLDDVLSGGPLKYVVDMSNGT